MGSTLRKYREYGLFDVAPTLNLTKKNGYILISVLNQIEKAHALNLIIFFWKRKQKHTKWDTKRCVIYLEVCNQWRCSVNSLWNSNSNGLLFINNLVNKTILPNNFGIYHHRWNGDAFHDLHFDEAEISIEKYAYGYYIRYLTDFSINFSKCSGVFG